eukprot:6878377-Prymnesium_polylepis.1
MIASSEPAFRRADANFRPCEWFRGISYRAPALASVAGRSLSDWRLMQRLREMNSITVDTHTHT